MTAKEYLRQAYRLDQKINSKLEQIECLRSLCQRVTPSYDGEKVSHTKNVHYLQDAIIRIMEAEEELNHQIDDLVRLRIEISSVIEQVDNPTYRLLLEKRYLCFLTWEQIASDMNYSRRWVLRCHGLALRAIENLLDQKEKSL